MTLDLFAQLPNDPWTEALAPGAVVLHHYARDQVQSLLGEVAVESGFFSLDGSLSG